MGIKQFEIDDDKKRLISGWLTVETVDRQGDIIPVSEIVSSMYNFMDRGGHIIYAHTNKPIGKILQWELRKHPETGTFGIHFVAKIFDDYEVDNIVWDQIKKGMIKGFSIGATAKSVEQMVIKDSVSGERKQVRVLKDIDLFEVSAVPYTSEPANQFATIEEVNFLAKSIDKTRPIDKKVMETYAQTKIDMEEELVKALIEIEKPFAGFNDWDDCLKKMKNKGYSEESAKRICGKLKAEFEKFVLETVNKTFTADDIAVLSSLRAKYRIEKAERPPKEWWDKCYKRIKDANPNYTDEQARAVCGSMWYHGWGMGKGER